MTSYLFAEQSTSRLLLALPKMTPTHITTNILGPLIQLQLC